MDHKIPEKELYVCDCDIIHGDVVDQVKCNMP